MSLRNAIGRIKMWASIPGFVVRRLHWNDAFGVLLVGVKTLASSRAACSEVVAPAADTEVTKDRHGEGRDAALAEAQCGVTDTLVRISEIILEYGADESDDIAGFIERIGSERNKLDSELVEVRASLAAVTAERDSLRATVDEWSNADTKPHDKEELRERLRKEQEAAAQDRVRHGEGRDAALAEAEWVAS